MNQTCPRRMCESGPWEYKEGLDLWRERDRPNEEWNWHWVPRQCSFCGSVHPEDVIKLLSEGWEFSETTKSYKGYLCPPGNKEKTELIRRNLRTTGETGIFPSVWSIQLKFYIHHFDKNQVDRLNEVIREAR